LPQAGELDQHRQVDTRDDLYPGAVHDRDCEVRRGAAEHVGQQYGAVTGVDCGNRPQDVLPALFHVVIRPNADGGNLRLRADDVLERGNEFRCEPPMGHQNHTDHWIPLLEPQPSARKDRRTRRDRRGRAGQ
jgi:hypothetical protein